jgi:hypothetical protein
MIMNMLHRGGIPCAGRRPAFEPEEMMPPKVNLTWLRGQRGEVVKWVSPLYSPITPADMSGVPAATILMGRDVKEMARSQVKMMSTIGVMNSRQTRLAMARSMVNDQPRMEAMLNALGSVYHLSFEWVLANPEEAASKLQAIIRAEFNEGFNAEEAARVPLKRPSACAPDLSIEENMLRSAR